MASNSPVPYPEPELSDDLICLRRWEFGDIDCIKQASQEGRIPEGTTVPVVYTPAEGRAFIERQWGRQTKGEGLSLAIADNSDRQARGLVCLMRRRISGTAEIGYWVVPDARGAGRATNAVRLLSRWAVSEGGFERIEGLVEPENTVSRRVLEACGFRPEGTLRSYLAFTRRRADAVIYSLLPSDLVGT